MSSQSTPQRQPWRINLNVHPIFIKWEANIN
jgi:hypothetical protein